MTGLSKSRLVLVSSCPDGFSPGKEGGLFFTHSGPQAVCFIHESSQILIKG